MPSFHDVWVIFRACHDPGLRLGLGGLVAAHDVTGWMLLEMVMHILSNTLKAEIRDPQRMERLHE